MKTVFPQHMQSHLVVSRRYARRPATLQDRVSWLRLDHTRGHQQ